MTALQRSRFLDLIAVGGLAGISSAALVRGTALAQTPSPLPLRVGATANDTYASAYYAQDLGLFARAGLTVDLLTLSNGAAIAAGIFGGSLDVGVSTPIAIASAYLRGLPAVIVAAGALVSDKVHELGICVGKNSGIKNAKALEGKTVAVNVLKSGSQVSLDAWLGHGGADVAKVQVVEMGFSQMGPAIERGVIAAAVISEPALSVALAQNNIVTLGDPSFTIGRQYLLSCWFSSRPIVDANREAIRRFQQAIYAAQTWANTHQHDSAVILAKYAKLDVADIEKGSRAPLADQLRLSDIQPFLDVAAKYGMLDRPVSADSLAYHS